MTDFMLRTNTVLQMDDALVAAELLEDGPMGTYPVAGCYVDRIGAIPPTFDSQGQQIKAGDPRFHANIRVTFELTPEQVEALPTVTPEPGIPYRVFA